MIQDAPERFELGRVVSRTFSVLGRNWPGFIGLSALLTTPLLAMAIFSEAAKVEGGAGFGISQIMAGFGAMAAVLLYFLFSLVLQAALVQATITDLDGEKPRLGACLATALRHIVPLVGVGFLYFLAMALGFVLLVVPGFMALCALAVAVPARVTEHTGVLDSLGRSADLTKGHRWKIFALFLGLLVIGILAGVVIGILEVVPLNIMPLTPAARTITAAFIQWGLRTVVGALAAVGIAALYYELRMVKEGVGAQQLAAAFD